MQLISNTGLFFLSLRQSQPDCGTCFFFVCTRLLLTCIEKKYIYTCIQNYAFAHKVAAIICCCCCNEFINETMNKEKDTIH